MPSKKPESLLSILKALGEFALLTFGIVGLSVRLFHEQGWLRQLLEKLLTAAFTSSILALIVGAVAIVIAKSWFDAFMARADKTSAYGNMLMYAMMLAGVYFLILFITTGSFR